MLAWELASCGGLSKRLPYLIKCEHLTNHLAAINESNPHPVVDLSMTVNLFVALIETKNDRYARQGTMWREYVRSRPSEKYHGS